METAQTHESAMAARGLPVAEAVHTQNQSYTLTAKLIGHGTKIGDKSRVATIVNNNRYAFSFQGNEPSDPAQKIGYLTVIIGDYNRTHSEPAREIKLEIR